MSNSDSPNKENTIDVSVMGDVIGKEAVEAETEELSSEIPKMGSEREDADGSPGSDDLDGGAASLENQIYSLAVSTLVHLLFIKTKNKLFLKHLFTFN